MFEMDKLEIFGFSGVMGALSDTMGALSRRGAG
jgi:hypothetical protein